MILARHFQTTIILLLQLNIDTKWFVILYQLLKVITFQQLVLKHPKIEMKLYNYIYHYEI